MYDIDSQSLCLYEVWFEFEYEILVLVGHTKKICRKSSLWLILST